MASESDPDHKTASEGLGGGFLHAHALIVLSSECVSRFLRGAVELNSLVSEGTAQHQTA